jgi:peptidoglycan/LPS O-acetylase OafA/YrhL
VDAVTMPTATVTDAAVPAGRASARPPVTAPASRPDGVLRPAGVDRVGFRPDIEGLRAVAVLTVLGYHAFAPLFGGGYIGVDVFFVISGFLITGLLLAELARRGRVSLATFYARRARRILPAAAVVLVATVLGSRLLLAPLRQRDVAYDAIVAALQAGNWRFVAGQTDYLAADRAPSPLLHYWSLAVEEQFYLMWAPALLALGLLVRRVRWLAITIALVTVTAGSFAMSLYWTATTAPLAYLGTPSRAWQFGVGALLALASRAPGLPGLRTVPAWARAGLGWAGLAAIGYATVAFSSHTPYPGTAALVPTLGTAAVIASGRVRALGAAPVRAIGRLSYAWYLWHWPVLVLAEARVGPLSWPLKAALVVASAVPAALTLRLVERPLRLSVTLSGRPRRGLAVGATAILLPVAAALVVGSSATRAMTGSVAWAGGPLPAGAATGPALLDGVPDPGTHGPVRPAPAGARTDYPPDDGCEIPLTATESPPCRFGAPAGADRVVLLGDSHAGHWYSSVAHLAGRRHWAVEVLVKPGCPLATVSIVDPHLGRAYRECDAWRETTLRRLAGEARPRLILISSLNRYGLDRSTLANGWDTTMRRLTALGVPIGYLRDTPLPGRDVPACLSGSLDNWAACGFPRDAALQPDPVAAAIAAGAWPDTHVVDVNDVLCPATTCPAVISGILLYRDDTHLTNTAAVVLGPRVERILTDERLLPTVH